MLADHQIGAVRQMWAVHQRWAAHLQLQTHKSFAVLGQAAVVPETMLRQTDCRQLPTGQRKRRAQPQDVAVAADWKRLAVRLLADQTLKNWSAAAADQILKNWPAAAADQIQHQSLRRPSSGWSAQY